MRVYEQGMWDGGAGGEADIFCMHMFGWGLVHMEWEADYGAEEMWAGRVADIFCVRIFGVNKIWEADNKCVYFLRLTVADIFCVRIF